MSAGKAIIASKIPAHMDILEDQETALLFASGDSAELAEKLIMLLRNEGWAERLGHKARNVCLSRYSLKEVVQKYLDVYEQLILAHRTRRPGMAFQRMKDQS